MSHVVRLNIQAPTGNQIVVRFGHLREAPDSPSAKPTIPNTRRSCRLKAPARLMDYRKQVAHEDSQAVPSASLLEQHGKNPHTICTLLKYEI